MSLVVSVRLFGTIKEAAVGRPPDPQTVELPCHAQLRDLLDNLGISQREPVTAIMDGRPLKPDNKLEHNKEINLFNPVFGG